MKISWNWLKQYHNLDLSPDKVADMLTGCGLEVECQESFQSIKGGLKGVVIGQVLTCEKHPNSDHLSLTTVDVGTGTPLNIVCGASNVAAGQKVAVATIGTTLYFNDKELTLQKTKIRGELSEGMICAEDELGLGTSHDGIMVLDPSAPVGMSAALYFKIEEDIVFSIGLTPNRVDASSHLGTARDLVAVANNAGRDSAVDPAGKLQIPDISSFGVDNHSRITEVIVEDAVACPRYSGITMTGITVGDSPDWLKNRLMAIGLRPINNVVDITNFVLMETGQPLHAFDADRIAGGKVVVRKYPAGTRFTTLDEVERSLSDNDLMICSSTEPMCIAGVFGGAGSGVTPGTTSIFLESACFDPKHIRRTAKYHGLQTDASFRFERGTSIENTIFALKRAALLIRELCGGTISSEIVDIYPKPFAPAVVEISFHNVDRLIGKKIDRKVIGNILKDLDIEILEETPSGLRLRIPPVKVDVTREADVVEEILRIYGYNNVEIDGQVRTSLSFTSGIDPDQVRNQVSDYLAANGFTEIMNNSLTKSAYYNENIDFPVERCVRMMNPISRDLDVMRQTLLYGVLESLVFNMNRKTQDLKVFEFGRVYSLGSNESDPVAGYHEENHFAVALTGRNQPENWNAASNLTDLFELKGFLDAIRQKLAIPQGAWEAAPFRNSVISDGLVYSVRGKQVIVAGYVGNAVLRKFDIRQPVVFAEADWDMILKLIPGIAAQYKEIPKFPEVRRDLALLLDREVTFGQVEQIAFQAERKLLKEVGLFDVYEGDQIAAGKKSYAVSFILQDREKTLTEKDIDKAMDRILKALVSGVNAQIR